MRLINKVDSLEKQLAANVLAKFGPPELGVYGCGTVKAGEAFEELIAAFQAGQFAGMLGLVITEELITQYAPEIRAHIGAFMQLGGRQPIVADRLSEDSWCQHLGFNARRGPYIGLAAAEEDAKRGLFEELFRTVKWASGWVFTGSGDFTELGLDSGSDSSVEVSQADFGVVALNDVGVAMACAILDIPCLYYAKHPWGETHHQDYLPIVRFAREVDATSGICYSRTELEAAVRNHQGARVDLSAQRTQVEQLLTSLAQPIHDPLDAMLNVPTEAAGTTAPAASAGVEHVTPVVAVKGFGYGAGPGRLMELGSIFDPATHYDDDYYGGGRGIRYYEPNGKIATYHGTAHDWDGFRVVADWLLKLIERGKLLDMGCGSGAFVKHTLNAGFDSYGADISSRAIAHADQSIAKRLTVCDVTKDPPSGGSFDIVTALDFWEHVYQRDIEALMNATHSLLRVGGLGFFVICTRGSGEADWTIVPGTRVTKENSWLLVSGHVTIRRWSWWADLFEKRGFKPRLDLCQLFQVLRCEDPAMSQCASWSARHTLFVQRIS